MLRTVAAIILMLSLTACDAVGTFTEGAKLAKAIENDLEKSLGLKPQVGFNVVNGRLRSVTVMFPRIHETKSLRELTDAVRAAVSSGFKEKPDQIVVGFRLRANGESK